MGERRGASDPEHSRHCRCSDALPQFAEEKDSILDFIDSLWTAAGGFHGTWDDDDLDIEYTYYGLLALGHLAL